MEIIQIKQIIKQILWNRKQEKTIIDFMEMDFKEIDFNEMDFIKKTIMDFKEIDFKKTILRKGIFKEMYSFGNRFY